MQAQAVLIPSRFCGPSRSGNGGYCCGLLAAPLQGAVSVRLFAPPPLETAMTLQHDADSSRLLHGETLIGEARRVELDLLPPPAPTFEQAVAASRRYAGFTRHSFPGCFVCGPQRASGDGLHVFAGPLEHSDIVASPWIVDASLAVDGKVGNQFVWAALDCPGAFAAVADINETPVLLGQLTARIDRSVGAGQRCIAIGWPIGSEGRKHFAGTAVFTDSGDLIAVAKATWIAVEKGRFE